MSDTHSGHHIERSTLLGEVESVEHVVVGRSPAGDAGSPHLAEDCRALLRGGHPSPEAVLLRQRHGTDILDAAAVAAARGAGPAPEADGAVASGRGALLRVVVADCVPLFLADREHRAVALVHAGWRGAAAGIVPRALSALRERGVPGGSLVAWAGPSIGPCCYEVGGEVIDAFRGEAAASRGRSGRWMLDLYATIRGQLRRGGVPGRSIEARPPCTRCRSDLLYSHRAGHEGRNVALLRYLGDSRGGDQGNP